jgi:hypothetical protein
MADVNQLYNDLDNYVGELAERFIDHYLPANPSTNPSAYATDVKAYSVLCHAAFEDFVEAVVLKVADHSVRQWALARKATDVVLALLCWHGAKLKIDSDVNNNETKPFDYLRPLLDDAKAAFSREVNRNHGISILYLRGLLIPVAIEVTQEPNLLNSLKQLTEGRGLYAHKGHVKTVLAPEDAKGYVSDVLALCKDVRDKAVAKLI